MKKLVTIFVVAVTILVISGLAQATTVYQNGFEPTTYTTGALVPQDGWSLVTSPDGFTVQNSIFEGTQAVQASLTNTGSAYDERQLALSVGATDILTFSYDVYLTDAWVSYTSTHNLSAILWNNETGFLYSVQPRADGPSGHLTNHFRIYVGGQDPGETVPYDLSLIQNQWVNLSLVVDNGTGMAQAYLNGAPLGDPVALTYGPGELTDFPIASLVLRAAGTSTRPAYVDNVSVSIMSVPEPATMALLGLGGLALLRKRRT